MTPSCDIHLRDDGSIDLDHYRRAAARERQQRLRLTGETLAATARWIFAAIADWSAAALHRPRPLVR